MEKHQCLKVQILSTWYLLEYNASLLSEENYSEMKTISETKGICKPKIIPKQKVF